VPERDLYEILGVSRGVSPAELKSAYRKLAKELHPDRNPGDKRAEDRFKEVSAAFEVLSDPKRRALYDEFGPDALRTGFDEKRAEAYRQWKRQPGGGRGPIPFDLGDFETVNVGGFGAFDFASIFGDLFRRASGPPTGSGRAGFGEPGPVQGADAEAELEVELGDAVRGAERELRINGKTLRVRVPAGVSDGSRIRLQGQSPAGGRGRPGDLYLNVRLKEHPLVRRDGRDLSLDLPVTIPEAVEGAEVTMSTFEGPVLLRIPAGSQGGTRLRLRGKGLPDLKGGSRGDLFAVLKLVLPEAGDSLRKAVEPLRPLYKGDPRAGISL
jgi:curved DNA-binding protein